jgi:hypothetical protein
MTSGAMSESGVITDDEVRAWRRKPTVDSPGTGTSLFPDFRKRENEPISRVKQGKKRGAGFYDFAIGSDKAGKENVFFVSSGHPMYHKRHLAWRHNPQSG